MLFVLALLAEGGELDDPSVLRKLVGDASGRRAEGEAQFEQAIIQTPRQWHPVGAGDRRETIDNDARPLPLDLVELLDPVEYLVVELDLNHNDDDRTYTIIAQVRS